MRLQSWELELQRVVSSVLLHPINLWSPAVRSYSLPHKPLRGTPAALGLRAGTDQVGSLGVSGEEPAELQAAAGLGQGVA